METKINVAAILKDKPQGTKLYADAFGELSIEEICTEDELGIILLSSVEDRLLFYNDGKYNMQGEPILVPSKPMHDWSKFAWKKGDVLKNTAYEERVIFDGFLNDDYTYFKGKHPLDCSNKLNITYHEECNCFTGNYRLESEDAAQTYINTIEEKLGGKLNRETLKIEKAQPEFKDGDVVAFGESVAIYKKLENDELYFYACIETAWGLILSDSVNTSLEYRLATDSEKQQLFDALAKKGKRWNAKKKKVVDLPKKCEFKPMDWCLMRGGKEHFISDWTLCQFSHKMECGKYRSVGGCAYDECISYNDQTKHLLGTTDEWKGGEQ